MEIEFDPAKDVANIENHGVSLAFGRLIFDDPSMLIVDTIRIGDEEDRYKAIGVIDRKLWTAVHVHRGPAVRFISVRRSNAGEELTYRNSR